MIIKRFIFSAIISYLFLSLLLSFSIGYTIDWIPEATLAQKIKGYAFEGFTRFNFIKVLIAVGVGTLYSLLYLKLRSPSSSKR
ncbi:hypothetical protein [Exiguobacterium sp. JMULE1]|uniref:hypothetical protein n=1 Tax=Exiguobacterium sp. JMULE1 TaxID=2518339 RepID=UPI0015760F37|nr:hypothetical protein [Exiguobacterium sp. JMULE1]